MSSLVLSHWCHRWCCYVIVGVMLSVVKASWWILDEQAFGSLFFTGFVAGLIIVVVA
ncbi:3731_t:CDS:2 [Dentiscutata erythropus]|uniref:3731_t:CDS:1 n=1 Tax=Dentiscutata erythropus TaxID=1348616 RepID=A0A9N9JS26_9GLOM|nr:3731_t:CDS:2 [Dentiscutata erythropus]